MKYIPEPQQQRTPRHYANDFERGLCFYTPGSANAEARSLRNLHPGWQVFVHPEERDGTTVYRLVVTLPDVQS